MDTFTPEQVEEMADNWSAIDEPETVAMLRAYAERLRQDDKDALDAGRYRWILEQQHSLVLLRLDVDRRPTEDLLDDVDLSETIDDAMNAQP